HRQEELGCTAPIRGLQDAADSGQLAELRVVVCAVIAGEHGAEPVGFDEAPGPIERLTEQDVTFRRGDSCSTQSPGVWAAHGAVLGTAGEDDAPEVVCHHGGDAGDCSGCATHRGLGSPHVWTSVATTSS